MPLGMNFQRAGKWNRRLVIGGAGVGEVNPPLHIIPQAVAPTDVTEGNIWFDSVSGTLKASNGVAYAGGGAIRPVKTGAATLTEADSGALCIFNAAAGFLYTLPPAAAGLWFEFVVQTTVTSSVARIACASGDFLKGTILQGQDTTFTQVARTADGTTHLAWEGNGTTTGGIIGDAMIVTAISATQWDIHGLNTATGTEATPFKTS